MECVCVCVWLMVDILFQFLFIGGMRTVDWSPGCGL